MTNTVVCVCVSVYGVGSFAEQEFISGAAIRGNNGEGEALEAFWANCGLRVCADRLAAVGVCVCVCLCGTATGRQTKRDANEENEESGGMSGGICVNGTCAFVCRMSLVGTHKCE